MGMSFLNLMKPIISDKDLNTLNNYLKLQFKGKVVSSQLDKFNPLTCHDHRYHRERGAAEES